MDWQVVWLLALENPAGVDAGLTVRFLSIAAVAHQTSGRGERSPLEDRGHSVVDRQGGELLGPAIEDCIGADHERAGSQLGQGREDRIEIAFGAGMQDMQLHSEDAGRRLQVSQYGLGIGIGWVDERGNDGRRWYQLVRQLQSFRHYLHVQLGHARDVAARPIEASDETELNRIAGGGEDNGNRRNRPLLPPALQGYWRRSLPPDDQPAQPPRPALVLFARPPSDTHSPRSAPRYSLFSSTPAETRPPSVRMRQAMRR